MKNIKFLFVALAMLAASAFTACQEDWTPGAVDSPQSVYLPVDVDVAAFEVDGSVAKYPVYRKVAGDEMEVEIRGRMIDPIFEIPENNWFTFAPSVIFEEGETVGYLEIYLSKDMVGKLTIGELFDAEIMISNAEYHGNYGLSRRNIQIGIPETWKEIGEGYYFDGLVSMLYGVNSGVAVKAVYEESESRANVYRVKNAYSVDNVVSIIGGVPGDMKFAKDDAYLMIDVRQGTSETPEAERKIGLMPSFTGFEVVGWGEYVGGDSDKLYLWSFDSNAGDIYHAGIVLEEFEGEKIAGFEGEPIGTITCAANTALWGVELGGQITGGYIDNTNTKFVFPGISILDYSMSVAFGGMMSSANGAETYGMIGFGVGADVASFRYVVVPGKQDIYVTTGVGMNATTALNENIDNLMKADPTDEEDPLWDENNMVVASRNQLSWYIYQDTAGIYTVFAVPYDEKGNAQVDEIVSTYFYYRAVNDDTDVPTIAQTTIEFVAMEFENHGIRPEEYYQAVTFSNDDFDYISDMRYYAGSVKDIETYMEAYGVETREEFVAQYGANGSAIIDYLKDGNGSTTLSVLQDLIPGTKYVVMLQTTSIYGKTDYVEAEVITKPYGYTEGYEAEFKVGTYKVACEAPETDETGEVKVDADGNVVNKKYEVEFTFHPSATYYDEPEDASKLIMVTVPAPVLDKANFEAGKETDDFFRSRSESYTFYGEFRPDLGESGAILLNGQVKGYEGYGSLFAVGLEEYNPAKSQWWAFASCVDTKYADPYDTMVIFLKKEGDVYVPDTLYTNFKQYYYYTEIVETVNAEGKKVRKEVIHRVTLWELLKDTTTFEFLSEYAFEEQPVVDDNTGNEGNDDTTGTDDDNADNAVKASMRFRVASEKPAVVLSADFSKATMTVNATVSKM